MSRQEGPRGPVPIGQAIRSLLKETGLSAAPGHQRVFRAWDAALGSGARIARPVRFRGGVLTVEVESSAHLQELRSFTGDDYRRQANDRLGSSMIESVKFRLKS